MKKEKQDGKEIHNDKRKEDEVTAPTTKTYRDPNESRATRGEKEVRKVRVRKAEQEGSVLQGRMAALSAAEICCGERRWRQLRVILPLIQSPAVTDAAACHRKTAPAAPRPDTLRGGETGHPACKLEGASRSVRHEKQIR